MFMTMTDQDPDLKELLNYLSEEELIRLVRRIELAGEPRLARRLESELNKRGKH